MGTPDKDTTNNLTERVANNVTLLACQRVVTTIGVPIIIAIVMGAHSALRDIQLEQVRVATRVEIIDNSSKRDADILAKKFDDLDRRLTKNFDDLTNRVLYLERQRINDMMKERDK